MGDKRKEVSGRLYLAVKGLVMGRMMVEDSGKLNLGSDHNLIWCEVGTGRLEEGTSDPCLKWKVNSKNEWEEYQQLVIEGLEDGRNTWKYYGWEGTEKVYNIFGNHGDILHFGRLR